MLDTTILACAACAVLNASPGPQAAGVIDTGAMTIYEVNIRQYTPEGTFDAFRAHIPRLKELGVGVLWLMPIHPIGEVNRKGTLGSYYAVKDYTAVNPEFGTDEDFRELVDAAHDAGMLVILDWVANHTAWDHPWTVAHPERFTVGPDGGFIPPNPGWADVIDLHFDDPGTRVAMTEAMEYWVREFDIDGYRCDVADDVPHDFWKSSIEAVRAIRPVFMLAEADAPSLHGVGFEASYGWGLGGTLMRIAKGEAEATAVRRHVERDAAALAEAPGAFRMHFTTNHDWNSWEGTAIERLGPMWEAATVLTFTLPGMPLVYSGQEAGLDTMLEFFEKDEIVWREHPARALYTKLTRLKREQSALHHGAAAGAIEFLDAGDPKRIVAFRRAARGSEVVVFANLSPDRTRIVAPARLDGRAWTDLDGQAAALPESLGAWEWRILWRKP